jgi:protein required for attachment to host cells
MDHWIVVADSASCHVYRADERIERMTPVLTIHNRELHPDADHLGPRGATQSAPGGAHARFERHTDPQDALRAKFARQVAKLVDQAAADGSFERLVVAAPPKFLGDLRDAFGHATASRLVASIHHDYTKTHLDELPGLIRKHVTAG